MFRKGAIRYRKSKTPWETCRATINGCMGFFPSDQLVALAALPAVARDAPV